MLKKFISVVCLSCLIGSGNLVAETISPELAQTVAVNFINADEQSNKTVRDVSKKYVGDVLTGYIVNFNEGGWVMVSANDVIEPIICFNLTGYNSNVKDDEENPILEIFAKGIKLESTSLKSANAKVMEKWASLSRKSSSQTSNGLKSIEPYLTQLKINIPPLKVEGVAPFFTAVNWETYEQENIEWNQYRPYNDECANKNCYQTSNQKVPAGCTAIAVGQLVYWGHLKEYDFNWNGMPAKRETVSSSKTKDMSRAIKKIADDLHTEYTCNGSSAYLQFAPPILYKYGFFWVSPYLSKANWSNNEWANLMKSELVYHKPILADGQSVDKKRNHTFVICGYLQMNGSLSFYCNMGQQDTDKNCYYNFADNASDYISGNVMKGMYIGLNHYQFISNYNYAKVASASTNGITIKERCASNYLLIVERQGKILERTAGCMPKTEHQYADYTHTIKPKNSVVSSDTYYLIVFGQNGTQYFYGKFDGKKPYNESIDYSSWPQELVNALGAYSYKSFIEYFKNNNMSEYAQWLADAHISMNNNADEDNMVKRDNRLKVSPNPTHGQATVFINSQDSESTVIVSDALGNTIRTFQNVTNSVDISLEGLKSGVYYVRVIAADFDEVEKIILR